MGLDLDLAGLRETYRRDLFDDYLPFLDSYVIDHELGGFLCHCSALGERLTDTKRTWYEGRGMWVYAFLYREFTHDQRHLDIALRSWDLLLRTGQPWPADLRRDGSAAGPADPEVYSDLFVAEGLAELSRATGDSAFRAEARSIVWRCVERFDRADYAPFVGQTYLGSTAPSLPGARVLGVWMVLLRTATQLLEAGHDAEVERLADRCLAAIFEAHLNPRLGLLNEVLNHDLTRASGPYERLVYLGHAIETLWMVLAEARRRADAALFARAASLFRRHCERATDRTYGGLFRNLLDADQGLRSSDKTLFVHQEALIGALLLAEAGDPWAVSFHQTLDAYTRTAFSLRAIGSPLWRIRGDRRMACPPDEQRVENYHHPRFLMLSLQAFDRLGGALS